MESVLDVTKQSQQLSAQVDEVGKTLQGTSQGLCQKLSEFKTKD